MEGFLTDIILLIVSFDGDYQTDHSDVITSYFFFLLKTEPLSIRLKKKKPRVVLLSFDLIGLNINNWSTQLFCMKVSKSGWTNNYV